MNKVILTGNLCRDIEVRQTQQGKKVISNAVAVSRDRKEADGTYQSDFINIVVWDKQAEYMEAHAHKGDRVELTGRWTVRKYQNKDGVTVEANECMVESISVFKKDTATTATAPAPTAQAKAPAPTVEINEDDIPF